MIVKQKITRPLISWEQIYSETALYKAAIRLYTKPIFSIKHRWQSSHDEQTFYDFSRKGLQHLDTIHQQLANKEFVFGEGEARKHEINGKTRTMYIYPWAERLVDLLLYRELSEILDTAFHNRSYAYRLNGKGVDQCQREIKSDLKSRSDGVYVIKRDIKSFFDSIDHDTCIKILKKFFAKDDYLFKLLSSRVRFSYIYQGRSFDATQGVPFGTAISCILANLYLTELDHQLDNIENVTCYRYADDFLLLADNAKAAKKAIRLFEKTVNDLKLEFKNTHTQNMILGPVKKPDQRFMPVSQFTHLGLAYAHGGHTTLSREKYKKLQQLFKDTLSAKKRQYEKYKKPEKRAAIAAKLCRQAMQDGINGIALIDYYLRHVNDDECWRKLDLWLAEECLHWAFGGGHKKNYFKIIPFKTLRKMGLPSFKHRQRLIQHGQIESAFFIWQNQQMDHDLKNTEVNDLL